MDDSSFNSMAQEIAGLLGIDRSKCARYDFSTNAVQIVKRETLPPNDVCACDRQSRGSGIFNVNYLAGADGATGTVVLDALDSVAVLAPNTLNVEILNGRYLLINPLTGADVTVKGGKYGQDVTSYLAPRHAIVPNPDGDATTFPFMVSEGYRVTFANYNARYGQAGYQDSIAIVNTADNRIVPAPSRPTYVGTDQGDITSDNGAVPFPALADATENTDVITKYNGQTIPVVLQDRTLYKDGKWNTLCLPFSLTAEQIAANADFAGATLMTLDVTQKNGFDTEDGTLYLGFKTATEIEAGVPYLVKWTSGDDISNPVFEGVTISNSTAQAVESVTAGLETVQMVGTYSPVGVTADDKSILFLGDANTLYYSTIDRQIRSCRVYFSVPYIKNNAGAKARAFALSFDGEETTGISLTPGPSPKGEGSDYWYTIDGRKLSGKPSQRGMYINKGKKIVVK